MSTTFVSLAKCDQGASEVLGNMCRARYLNGECYAFAIAMHRATGFPMVGLVGELQKKTTVIHAAVLNPEGKFFDARGVVSEEEFGKPFGYKPPYRLKQVSEPDLRDIRPVDEHEIN